MRCGTEKTSLTFTYEIVFLIGAFLPPEQEELEIKYKGELKEMFDIEFNSLYTMTNMPVKRFADFLNRRGELQPYMELLVRNFNASNVDDLMCRELISVNYDGSVFDCDFNQQLALSLEGMFIIKLIPETRYKVVQINFQTGSTLKTIFDFDSTEELLKIPIRTDNHCYGCTAGKGSS